MLGQKIQHHSIKQQLGTLTSMLIRLRIMFARMTDNIENQYPVLLQLVLMQPAIIINIITIITDYIYMGMKQYILYETHSVNLTFLKVNIGSFILLGHKILHLRMLLFQEHGFLNIIFIPSTTIFQRCRMSTIMLIMLPVMIIPARLDTD